MDWAFNSMTSSLVAIAQPLNANIKRQIINEIPEIKEEEKVKEIPEVKKIKEIPKTIKKLSGLKNDKKVIEATKSSEIEKNAKTKEKVAQKEEAKQDKKQINKLHNIMNKKLERKPPEEETQNNKELKVGASMKNLSSTLKVIASIIMLVTAASGAQIGTSHAKVSIMQINSIEISRKTWISENPQDIKEIVKIIKGPAIISERYVQEAKQIINDLGKPLRIEKNTITTNQEKEMLTRTDSINPVEISQTGITGYKEEEEKYLEKLIADLSIIFWIKEKNEISRILVSPKIDWRITTNYEDSKGEWQQNLENGWTSFIPGGAIISKPVEVFKKTARIGERSCITKANFSTKSSMTSDIIKIRNTEETILTENCRIGNRQITSQEKIKGNATISLPLECSVSSDILRCGRIKYLFENEEINQARIRRVSIEIEEKEQENTGTKPEVIAAIITSCIVIIVIIFIILYKTSTPNNSRPPSPNTSIEMEEMGPFKCLRTRNDTSEEREEYSIYNSYNSMDASWRLDRNNGENRSLNNTDVRRALIDSRFHQDEESAIACCYDPSFFKKETSDEKSLDSTQELTTKPKLKKKRKAPTIPEEDETTDTQQMSMDASWCLDRSDGTNRSLNQSEIEERKPTAPSPIYPQLPFNPYIRKNPPPMPVNTPPPSNKLGGIWIDDTPNQGELRGDEEEEMMYNHQLEPIKFKELEGLLTIGEQRARKENKK